MRCPFLLVLALAACGTLSSADQTQLASYQHNAGLYIESGKLDQALGLVERGLALAPADYKLRSMKASILLRQSGPPSGSDHRVLEASIAEFRSLYGDRSPARHDRSVLFFYALARERQGLRLLAESARQHAGGDAAAAATQQNADREFAAARDMLQVLLERGEIPRLCHYHLLQIAAATRDDAGVLAHGEQYLEAARKEQAGTAEKIDRTMVPGFESSEKNVLANLRSEEIEVRSFVADRLYGRKDFARALVQVNAVLLLDPTRSTDHYNRSRILRQLGRTDEAKDDLRRFLVTTTLPADNPKVVDAAQALQALSR